jgi:hypothetical protein
VGAKGLFGRTEPIPPGREGSSRLGCAASRHLGSTFGERGSKCRRPRKKAPRSGGAEWQLILGKYPSAPAKSPIVIMGLIATGRSRCRDGDKKRMGGTAKANAPWHWREQGAPTE